MAPTRKPWHWPTTQEPSNLAKIWESGNILIKNNQTGFRLITQVSFLTRETMLCRALPHSGLGTDSQDTRPGGAAGQTPGATGSPRPALPTPTSEPSPAAELRVLHRLPGLLSVIPLHHLTIRAQPEAAPREKLQKDDAGWRSGRIGTSLL